ncbi:hypothetical protein BJ165DRAFT_504109 [Panaeolus papilionaceus]|nr:hypothetical protein BJ165DRAFT_504109 [Panaeolus papilionaceus]
MAAHQSNLPWFVPLEFLSQIFYISSASLILHIGHFLTFTNNASMLFLATSNPTVDSFDILGFSDHSSLPMPSHNPRRMCLESLNVRIVISRFLSSVPPHPATFQNDESRTKVSAYSDSLSAKIVRSQQLVNLKHCTLCSQRARLYAHCFPLHEYQDPSFINNGHKRRKLRLARMYSIRQKLSICQTK